MPGPLCPHVPPPQGGWGCTQSRGEGQGCRLARSFLEGQRGGSGFIFGFFFSVLRAIPISLGPSSPTCS